jgi:hypothetical protein
LAYFRSLSLKDLEATVNSFSINIHLSCQGVPYIDLGV